MFGDVMSKLTDNYSKEKDFNNWDLNFGRIHQSSSKHGLVGFVVSCILLLVYCICHGFSTVEGTFGVSRLSKTA